MVSSGSDSSSSTSTDAAYDLSCQYHNGPGSDPVCSGELTRKVTVSAHAFSKSAREKIEGAGGSIQELG